MKAADQHPLLIATGTRTKHANFNEGRYAEHEQRERCKHSIARCIVDILPHMFSSPRLSPERLQLMQQV